MASAGRAARRDRGAVHVHSAALLQQLLDAAQRLQEHLASAARDLPSHSAAASCVSIAQACAVPTATHGSTAAHPPEPKPASRQPSPDPASTPGGASALPGAAPGRPDGLDVAAAALPGGTAAPSEPLKAQLFTCEQELEPRLPEAAGPAGAQGEAFAEQAAAASCPSNAPGAGLAQMLASVATGLDPKTGVVAEVAAILAADAAARAGQGVPGPSPEAHRRSCAPRRPAASAHTGSGRMPRDQEQPPWGRSAEGVDRRRAGGARWRMRQGRGVRPDAGGAPVTEARARGGARSRAMLPATEWTRVRPPAVSCAPVQASCAFPSQRPTSLADSMSHLCMAYQACQLIRVEYRATSPQALRAVSWRRWRPRRTGTTAPLGATCKCPRSRPRRPPQRARTLRWTALVRLGGC